MLEPFEINHVDKEYLLCIDGYYDNTSGVIQTLQFKTNMKTSDIIGYEEKGIRFSIGCKGSKIIGFHGYAEENLYSLGAYLTSLSLTKLECKGGIGGHLWDDGSFHGVRKVNVYYDSYVRCIGFEYDNNGKTETRQQGSKLEVVGHEGEFVLDYPNEFITSVQGTFKDKGGREMLITSLAFKTSKGRSSPTYGNDLESNLVEFVLESKGCALVGFHGRCSSFYIHSLGAYCFPMPSLQDADRLDA